jgi:asparagine synthase (glutamine-hydrolysing)
MCGICGIVDRQRPVSESALAAMTETLRHRGPDDRGLWVQQPEGRAAGVGLGFRRLSIIDVDGGNQPIANEDGGVRVVCNGEIYNYRELRSDLVSRGHHFATDSDCEVLVHLWEEGGSAMLSALNGMFALALWDQGAQTLFLARDRFGKKPLHYLETASGLLFGSELKALLAHPSCPRTLDHAALERYLVFDYVPSPRTAFEGIHKLPAGHSLVWHNGAAQVQRWWELPVADEVQSRSDGEWVDEFLAVFQDAVSRRLVSDVPLGAFLSGGLDSSAVVALMARSLPPGQLKTFSIGFDEPSYDESEHARAVARHVGAEHHERTFTVDTLLDLLPEVFGVLDEPFADASILPTFLLSRFAREHVTVALGGDGADELLAGYPTFQAERANRMLKLSPWLRRRVALPLANRLPPSSSDFSFEFKVRRFLRGADPDMGVRHQLWLGSFTPAEEAEVLLGPRSDPLAPVRGLADRARGDWLQRLVAVYVSTYLQDDILTKVDRASMANSLEVRAPFLDPLLVELLAQMPSNLKLRRFETKLVLRRAFGPLLPPETISRPKKGFGIPVAKWLRDDLRDAVRESLSPERLRSQGLFDPQGVARLLEEHNSGVRDHRKQLWALFAFQQWHHEWVERPRRAEPEAIGSPSRP